MNDIEKYQRMRDSGIAAEAVYRTAKADGIGMTTRLDMIKRLFNLSIIETKEVAVRGDRLANSLDEYQESLIQPLLESFKAMEDEDNSNDLSSQQGDQPG